MVGLPDALRSTSLAPTHGSRGPMAVLSTEVVYNFQQWSLPGAAVVRVLNVSSRSDNDLRCAMQPLDKKINVSSRVFFGLNWMIKLFWTAILCYSFHRSVRLLGRVLLAKGLRLPSCCRAVKMRMTGSISCCRKRTYDPLLQPGQASVMEISVCLLTECTLSPALGSPRCSTF